MINAKATRECCPYLGWGPCQTPSRALRDGLTLGSCRQGNVSLGIDVSLGVLGITVSPGIAVGRQNEQEASGAAGSGGGGSRQQSAQAEMGSSRWGDNVSKGEAASSSPCQHPWAAVR